MSTFPTGAADCPVASQSHSCSCNSLCHLYPAPLLRHCCGRWQEHLKLVVAWVCKHIVIFGGQADPRLAEASHPLTESSEIVLTISLVLRLAKKWLKSLTKKRNQNWGNCKASFLQHTFLSMCCIARGNHFPDQCLTVCIFFSPRVLLQRNAIYSVMYVAQQESRASATKKMKVLRYWWGDASISFMFHKCRGHCDL